MSVDALALKLAQLPRASKRALLLVSDSVLLILAVWAAYALRLGVWYEPGQLQWLLILSAPLLAIPVFVRLGLYRSVIRYLGEHALWSIVKAMAAAALLLGGLGLAMVEWAGLFMPRSVPPLYFMLGVLMTAGSRFGVRWFLWLPLRSRYHGQQVLVYGAGNTGRQLVSALRQGRQWFPAGFIDDNRSLQGKDIAGLRVYAPSDLQVLVRRFDIREVILALPSIPASRRREVVAFLEKHNVRVRILPASAEATRAVDLQYMLRDVDVGDLLGRDPVSPDPALLGRCVSGKSVLVTGAGGSIGSELCRQIVALTPARIVLLEASEHALYQIERELASMSPCPVIARLGSVCNESLVRAVLAENDVQSVYHAAAHKHVPMLEHNALEAIRNNVFGTRVVATEALSAGVETFVLISTDKAVRPTNVMGATKRWAELIVKDCAEQAAGRGAGQVFCAVRFGNVLGSSGSVVPVFKEQIARGGPVTLTHPEVTRYFMSIHEAVELVIQAGSLAAGGEVFLLDMGEPVKISDLARNLVRLAGKTVRDEASPEGDIEIAVIGLRPGEKLREELLIANNPVGTRHPKIMQAEEPGCEHDELVRLLEELYASAAGLQTDVAKHLLMKVAGVPGDDLTAIALPARTGLRGV